MVPSQPTFLTISKEFKGFSTKWTPKHKITRDSKKYGGFFFTNTCAIPEKVSFPEGVFFITCKGISGHVWGIPKVYYTHFLGPRIFASLLHTLSVVDAAPQNGIPGNPKRAFSPRNTKVFARHETPSRNSEKPNAFLCILSAFLRNGFKKAS